jgi:hypothetical protein
VIKAESGDHNFRGSPVKAGRDISAFASGAGSKQHATGDTRLGCRTQRHLARIITVP